MSMSLLQLRIVLIIACINMVVKASLAWIPRLYLYAVRFVHIAKSAVLVR